jgi:hypothetical protein
MIVSSIDGRIRIRREALKDPSAVNLALNFMKSRDGVLDFVSNLKTGSLLITYDPKKIPREAFVEIASALEKQLEPESGDKRRKRFLSVRVETGLLSVLYGLALLSGFTGRALHLTCAALLTGLTANHVYQRRKRLRYKRHGRLNRVSHK